MSDIDRDKQLTWLQYLNTVMLTLVGIFTTVIFFMITNVKESQSTNSQKMTKLETIQDVTTGNVTKVESRVTALELNYMDYLKNWVDQNYIRKPQK
jgi:ABC-type Fe3+-citrate transport system substrate-binding protein